MEEERRSVVVIGAGLAGLRCAQLLKPHYPDVLVVEASAEGIGGRLKQIHGMGGWPVEAGAEFVHGTKSAFTRLCAEFAAEDAAAAHSAAHNAAAALPPATALSFAEKPWPDRWWFGRDRLLTDKEPEEIERLHEIMDAVGDETPPPPGSDVAADKWLSEHKKATPLMMAAAEACYANDFGAHLAELGLREMIAENNRWDSGETYLVMEQPMSRVAERLARGLEVWLSWPVARVDSGHGGGGGGGGGGILLERAAPAASSSPSPSPSFPGSSSSDPAASITPTPARPRAIRAARVVVTVPLGVLKAGRVLFSPPLPERKRLAVRRLRFGNAIKLVLAFTRRFWPEGLYDVVCTDELVPEFWMTRRPVTDAANAGLSPVTGFCAGAAADAVAAMGDDAAVRAFVAQLDRVFGTDGDRTPATDSFAKSAVFDWAKQEHALGAYSFPSLGAEDGDREALAAPLPGGAVFFAGEATHGAVNPCMQAALETGDRAAAQVRASLGERPSSRL